MKISIEADGERKEILTVVVDDEPWAQIHQRIFGRRPRFESTTLDDLCVEFVEKEWRLAKVFALKCLGRKSYHSQELKKLLAEYLINEAIIEEVIGECRQLGYLDDKDFIEGLLRREKGRKAGPRKILWKIRHKGIKDESVEREMPETYPPEEQIEQMQKLIAGKYGKKDLTCPKERQKVWGALMRRGFSPDLIRQVFEDR